MRSFMFVLLLLCTFTMVNCSYSVQLPKMQANRARRTFDNEAAQDAAERRWAQSQIFADGRYWNKPVYQHF